MTGHPGRATFSATLPWLAPSESERERDDDKSVCRGCACAARIEWMREPRSRSRGSITTFRPGPQPRELLVRTRLPKLQVEQLRKRRPASLFEWERGHPELLPLQL
jgi:hypothetical protein